MGHGYKAVNRVLGELGRPERVREIEEEWRHSCVCVRERDVWALIRITLLTCSECFSALRPHSHLEETLAALYFLFCARYAKMHTRNIEHVR